MYDDNNVFARILRGEIPVNKQIFENDYALSFCDLSPAASIHALIIPKGKYTDVLDFSKNASAEEQLGFWEAFNKTVEIMNVTGDCNIIANVGKGVFCGQSVPHYHLHLVAGDKIKTWEEYAE